MPIDFLKCKILDDELIQQVWDNPLLEFDSKYEKRYDDVVYEVVTRKFENLFFSSDVVKFSAVVFTVRSSAEKLPILLIELTKFLCRSCCAIEAV